MIYFLDIEASSLDHGGFPIEVAWVDETGKGEAYLIRPADIWLDEDNDHPGWSWQSEQVHGIALSALMAEGVSHETVAHRAAEVLSPAEVVVFSDAVGFDAGWLETLFRAAGVATRVRLVDIQEAYGMACRPLLSLLAPPGSEDRERSEERVKLLAKQILAVAEEGEDVRPETRHRALPDAERLWRTWRAIRFAVANSFAETPAAQRRACFSERPGLRRPAHER